MRKVKIGVVGCGVVATAYYLPYIFKMENAELVAVCDSNPARTAACIRLFGAKEQYQDYYELLARSDIEAVFILTGPGTHLPFTLAAIEKGKHVLLQKPMALELHGANAIVEATRKAGVKVVVEPSSNSQLDPAYPPLRELIQKGVLGNVSWFSWLPGVPSHYHPSWGAIHMGSGPSMPRIVVGCCWIFPMHPRKLQRF